MQSILLTTPSKASKLEISHENKLSNEGGSIQDKDGLAKNSKGFASVLEKTVLESKELESKALESKELANKTLDNKDSEDKELQGKELKSKGSKEESLEKTAQVKNAKSLNNELVSKVLSNEEQPKDGKIDPLLLEKNQTSDASIKTLKNESENTEYASTKVSKTDPMLVQETKGTQLELENTDAVVTVVSTEDELHGVLSAKNTQAIKKQSDATVIAPIEGVSAREMTKEDHSFSSKDNLNLSEKLSKQESLAGDKVTPDFKASDALTSDVKASHVKLSDVKESQIKESDSVLFSSGQATSSEETFENSSVLIKNTSDINKLSKTFTDTEAINAEKVSEVELASVSGVTTNANIASVDKVNEEVSEQIVSETTVPQKINASEEASEIEPLWVKNTPKAQSDDFEANTKAVITEPENKPSKSSDLSEEVIEIDPVGVQNISNDEVSRNLNEQTPQLKGSNRDNSVVNNIEPQLSSVTKNKPSEEIIEEEIRSTDSEIVNLATLIDDVKSLKEVSQSEQNNDQETTDQVLTDSDLEMNDVVVNPILAQIQAAQKTDTKVSGNTLQAVGINNIEKGNKKDDKSTPKNDDKGFIKVDKNNVENVLADASEKSTLTEKDLINKANISANEKIEGMLANFRAEATKPLFNQNTESHSLNSLAVASASADKLLHQTQSNATNPTLQSSPLQQPLELQAKHASAMVGERIMMMLNQGKQEVTIRLDPAELGSMHIKLHVQQDQLQVAIQTQVGQSRDIIEQNLPRLREQLAQQGINLGEASVEQQSKQQSNSQDSSQMGRSAQGTSAQGESFGEEQSEFFPTQIPLPAQGIDYYA